MGSRLYYQDAYTTTFHAAVTEVVDDDGRQALVLDSTFFYPTSGGQPADRGTIDGIPVVGVSIRDVDGAILHWLDKRAPTDDVVEATIDWDRRFDHMQQHSGQHILSQAFVTLADARTIGFHLGDETVTIDLDRNDLEDADLDRVEYLSNEIIWQNRPIRILTVEPNEIDGLPLRKKPPIREGSMRLIEIDNFDLTACGGTHVSGTGEIGVIKIVRLERRGDLSRVEFCCGKRALRDYGRKNEVVNELTATLTTGRSDLVSAVERLREELKQVRRMMKRQQGEMMQYKAEHLLKDGTALGEASIVAHVFPDGAPAELRTLGKQLTRQNGVVALLGATGQKSQLLFARSGDAPGEMNKLMELALPVLGPSARGGGNVEFAQGGGPAADATRVTKAIEQAKHALMQDK